MNQGYFLPDWLLVLGLLSSETFELNHSVSRGLVFSAKFTSTFDQVLPLKILTVLKGQIRPAFKCFKKPSTSSNIYC